MSDDRSDDAPDAPAAAPAASAATPDRSWPQIQSLFVDDPHAAVQQAADVAGRAHAALAAAASNREQDLRDRWQSDSADTEGLRTALRDYRDLARQLTTWSRDLQGGPPAAQSASCGSAVAADASGPAEQA